MSNKSKKLVIFGLGDVALMAHLYFNQDTDYTVEAFTLSKEFLTDNNKVFQGLPVVPFEEIVKNYPPEEYDLYIAVGYNKLNKIREKFYYEAKSLGYKLATYVSPHATVRTDQIGENCFIFEDNTLQPFSKIGNNIILWSGNHIGHHAVLEDHCLVTSHAVLAGYTRVGRNSFIGVNSTIIDGITVGSDCIIGAGSLITRDTEPGSVYSARSAELSRVPSHKVRI